MKIYAQESVLRITKKVHAIYIFSFILFILLPLHAQEKNKKPDPSLIQSMVFPGLGQIREKQYVKGILFITAESACLIQAFIANHKGNSNYRKYRQAKKSEEVILFRQETERYDRKRNQYLLVGAGIWLINMTDIYFHIKKKNRAKISLFLNPQVNYEAKMCTLAITLFF